jgi:hypothetical protein
VAELVERAIALRLLAAAMFLIIETVAQSHIHYKIPFCV